MSSLRNIVDVTRAAQEGLAGWTRRVAAEAGVPVGSAGTGPRIAVYPVRATTVGRSGDAQGLPLMTPPELTRDPPAGVGATWLSLAKTLQAALDPHFPRADARPTSPSRPRPAPAIDQLPPSLGAWYRAQAGAAESWTWTLDRVVMARVPVLTWRAPVNVRLGWLLAFEGLGGDALPLSAAVAAALAFDNSFPVRVPPIAYDPELPSFLEAIARCSTPELATALREAVAGLDQDPPTVVSVVPGTELTAAQVLQLAVAGGRADVPHLHVSIGVAAGAVARFVPAAVPAYAGSHRRPGEPS